MRAMTLEALGPVSQGSAPLRLASIPVPTPGNGELLVRVVTSGVCHTELDEIEGRTPPPSLPVVLGHQVVGVVEERGPGAHRVQVGDRVGVAWIFDACGRCHYCQTGNENLCQEFRATGRDVNGGYAEYLTVPESSAFEIPSLFSDAEAAPLLCAGAIGYRSFNLSNIRNGQPLGLTGFGASGHLVLKMVRHTCPDSEVFVFARSESERAFAQELGASWSGDTHERAPRPLAAVIDTTPVWKPVVEGLRNLAPGGRLVINAIRKEDHDKEVLQSLDYAQDLWMEREIKSVANVARRDVAEFLALAAEIPLRPEVQEYALEEANLALQELKSQKIRGAKVLRVS
ncbi:MAG: zinc-dependent alcohol dehydrogenase family protein [Gemmatimonadetes bacterium]|nr:zinc-dependent alcohol dehydrogenase family protein [Gemmatimonadota bacterium]